jgi:hypothetical protein
MLGFDNTAVKNRIKGKNTAIGGENRDYQCVRFEAFTVGIIT